MSNPCFEVWLDEDRQIIRQRILGQLDVDQFRRLYDETGACAARLRCPGLARILVDGEGLGRLPKPTRSAAMDALNREDVERMAFVTSNRFVRIMMRFIVVATGQDKVRAFREEAEALKWLLS